MFKGLLALWGFIQANVQLIIVVLIGIAVAVKLGYEIYRFFFVKKDTSYCNGCSMCEISKIKKKKIS